MNYKLRRPPALWMLVALAAGGALGAVFGRPGPGVALAAAYCAGWLCCQALYRVHLRQGGESVGWRSCKLFCEALFAGIVHGRRGFRVERDQLQMAVATLREAAASMSDAVIIADRAGRIVWCNEGAGRLLNVFLEHDRGKLLTDRWRDGNFLRYFDSGDFSQPLELASPAQPALTLRVDISVYSEDKRMVLVRDITQAQRVEKMRVDFIANVSHELRTPLTVINGYIETLRGCRGQLDDCAFERVMAQMQAQSTRMEALVNDLTMLSRLESEPGPGEQQLIDVVAAVRRLVSDVAGSVGRDKQISTDIQPAVMLRGRDAEIYSAFGNLIGNACKYTAPQGEISIRWRVEADRAVFEVSDNGDGIEAEHLPRLTERFYRVDRSRSKNSGGTGLGLAIVKHVLMRHQAHLDIDSEPGVGSTFRCVFPIERISVER